MDIRKNVLQMIFFFWPKLKVFSFFLSFSNECHLIFHLNTHFKFMNCWIQSHTVGFFNVRLMEVLYVIIHQQIFVINCIYTVNSISCKLIKALPTLFSEAKKKQYRKFLEKYLFKWGEGAKQHKVKGNRKIVTVARSRKFCISFLRDFPLIIVRVLQYILQLLFY